MGAKCQEEILVFIQDLTGMRHTLVPSTVVAHTVSPVQITSPPTMQTQSHTTKTVVTTHTTVPSTKVTAWITVQNPASTTTLPKPSTTTTLPRTHSTLPTTQVPITVYSKCDTVKFVRALAFGMPVTASSAGFCTDGTRSQSEALLLDACAAGSPKTWTQGVNVMQNCGRIPKYTPVSTFLFGQYTMDGSGVSGIFLDCLSDGFKIGVQLCGHGPQVFVIKANAGGGRQDANSFYVVKWTSMPVLG